ncbi:MAG: Vitamin B12 dependent methionine synthase activation subunit [Clostridiales bacterium]|nr:Vitamin B12 dependent methionine synthase activation subunit [Clostridiales bacterium]
MKTEVLVKCYPSIPFDETEILRYAGCKKKSEQIASLLSECMAEAKEKICYRVCFCTLPASVAENGCDFGAFSLESRHLARRLQGSKEAILFAATLGLDLDRLIARYGRLSPAKGLLFQAIGAAQIEALCDQFCRDIEKDAGVRLLPRFSPGYGDLPLSVQKKIFSCLGCEERIGLFLNDSLLMIPTKSVTAFAGIIP